MRKLQPISTKEVRWDLSMNKEILSCHYLYLSSLDLAVDLSRNKETPIRTFSW